MGGYPSHYPKRYSRNPYNSYGSFGGYGSYGGLGGYVSHYPKRYSRNPYDSYGSFGGYGSYGGNPRESYDRPGRPMYRQAMDASWNGGSRYDHDWNGYGAR